MARQRNDGVLPTTGRTAMALAVVVCLAFSLPPVAAQNLPEAAPASPATPPKKCADTDLSKAVDRAGAALRRVNVDTTPQVQAKMQQLRDRRGWSQATYEAEAMAAIADARVSQLDMQASELVDRIDQLSKTRSTGEVDCATVAEIDTTGIELVATIRAKTAYAIARLDAAIAAETKPATATAEPGAVAPPSDVVGLPSPVTSPVSPRPTPPVAAPRASPAPSWSTTTARSSPPAQSTPKIAEPVTSGAAAADVGVPAPARPSASVGSDVFIPPADADGYSVEEIREATRGFFGQITTGLAEVIEHAFAKSGKPTAYVLGNEGGAAFLAGLRYGEGDLFVRTGGTRKVYWHGPSLGGDLGISGTKTMMLIYKLDSPGGLFSRFSGVEGSAFFVGGVGLTLLTNGRTIMAPIRSGVGLRIGANIGYLRFTETQTWNPF